MEQFSKKELTIIGGGVGLILFLLCILLIQNAKGQEQPTLIKQPSTRQTTKASQPKASSQATQEEIEQSLAEARDMLPDVDPDDWKLILVNRDHVTPEMSPDLVTIEGIKMDKRIEAEVKGFLAEARTIDPAFHLISGYRSVTYQGKIYKSYIEREMAANPQLSYAEAEKLVQTYSQPAGASEHQTGLAMDMSTVDSLNQADPAVIEQLRYIAPKYGFVLRFEAAYTPQTGIGYEDWHWRYVGVESARYMVEHQLSLEAYLDLFKIESANP